MAKKFPETLLEFEHWFRTEEACRLYLAKLRWGGGFQCPRCGHRRAWLTSRGLYHCASCKADTSVTAGTIFERSRMPLRLWFRACWWITNQKSGVTALGLQRLLGLGSYETAWMCMHKLRRAMIRPGRERLTGDVEVDETLLGGVRKRPASRYQKAVIGIAAEIRGKGIGRIRLKVLPNDLENSIVTFVRHAVEPGAELFTDGAHAYKALVSHGYTHQRTIMQDIPRPKQSAALPRVHRVASLLKRWLLGIYQGRVSRRQLDHYLGEFAFRFNRRTSEHRGMLFYRLLQQCVLLPPSPYRKIVGAS